MISIDIGIKNLSFCIFTYPIDGAVTVLQWDVVNLLQSSSSSTSVVCTGTTKKRKFESPCTRAAKFTFKEDIRLCPCHAKNHPDLIIPPPEMKVIKKLTLSGLSELHEKLIGKEKKTKALYLKAINEYKETHMFQPISAPPPAMKADTIDLITVGRRFLSVLDPILAQHMGQLTTVLIENQISPLAGRMKTIQGMLAQYFIMKRPGIDIHFVSAANKLKIPISQSHPADHPAAPSSYADRKRIGILYCRQLLCENENLSSLLSHFDSHKKKDDLADAFLQGYYWIKKD